MKFLPGLEARSRLVSLYIYIYKLITCIQIQQPEIRYRLYRGLKKTWLVKNELSNQN